MYTTRDLYVKAVVVGHKDYCLVCKSNPCTCAVVEYIQKDKVVSKGCSGDCDECANPC